MPTTAARVGEQKIVKHTAYTNQRCLEGTTQRASVWACIEVYACKLQFYSTLAEGRGNDSERCLGVPGEPH